MLLVVVKLMCCNGLEDDRDNDDYKDEVDLVL